MKVLLVQLDGKLPNIALMRIAAHHRELGDEVELRHGGERGLWDADWDRVYGSAIFEKSKPAVERLRREYPGAIIGGTWQKGGLKLEDIGITTVDQDYGIYPEFEASTGFITRGCRLKCGFCVVPGMEGSIRVVNTVTGVWRGDPHPRNLLIHDNDFFGHPRWREVVRDIIRGRFRVCISQGINVRKLTPAAAYAVADLPMYDDSFKVRRVYTAWDNLGDESTVTRGIIRLMREGVLADSIMVYMLVGYSPRETAESRDYRRAVLRNLGCRPYPMPFVRTPELIGFQRFVLGAYDKRFAWKDWAAARYRPERLKGEEFAPPLFEVMP